jgi:multidrug efflux pump subunit AcrB
LLSRFFIERPIFAAVIAIVIMVAGALAIRTLPIEQYPTIAPPSSPTTRAPRPRRSRPRSLR